MGALRERTGSSDGEHLKLTQGQRQKKTKPRLLVVSTTFPRIPGDSEPDFVWQMCEQLSSDFRVVVLAPSSQGLKGLERMGRSIVVRWRYAPAALETLAYAGGMSERLRARPAMWLLVPLFLAGLMLKAMALFRRHSFAVVHVHWLFPTLPLVMLARNVAARGRVPIACTAHGADVHGFRSPWLLKLKSWALRRCHGVAAVSDALGRRITHDCPNVRLSVLPMGIRSCDTKPSEQRSPADLIFVGRLVEKKGADTAVSIVAELRRRQRDVYLSVIGDGPERGRVEAMAAEQGISDRVTFFGALAGAQVSARFADAGIALLPFRTARNGDAEGLGLVALEALAGGCPLVASDTEVTRSVLVQDRHALLVAPDNVSAFASAVEATMDNYQQALARTRTAEREILQQYQWNSVGRSYRDWLHHIMATHRNT